MPSRSDLEIKSRLVLGLGLLSLVAVLLLRLLLPLLALVGLGAVGFWLWRSHCKKRQQQQRQQARINAKFYQLLQQQQGRISVLDFAMRTQLEGAAAQAYLNTQAQSFSAFFETTPQGDLIYVFSSAAVRSQASPAEAVWAYSEQAYSEQIRAQRAHAEKTQTAWNNAKQIRTLRQLAKNEQPDMPQPVNRLALTSGPDPEGPVSLPVKETAKGIAKEIAREAEKKSARKSEDTSERKSKGQSERKRVIQLPTARSQSNQRPRKQPNSHGSQAKQVASKVTAPAENASTLSEESRQSEVVQGRAYSASERIITIDVTAVRS